MPVYTPLCDLTFTCEHSGHGCVPMVCPEKVECSSCDIHVPLCVIWDLKIACAQPCPSGQGSGGQTPWGTLARLLSSSLLGPPPSLPFPALDCHELIQAWPNQGSRRGRGPAQGQALDTSKA
jgi:hypothetical protein